MAKSYITLDTRIDAFKDEFNNLVNKVGDLSSLTTSASGDSDLVQAINEHSAELGTITAGAMGTTASTVSTAIAELDSEADSDRTNFAANVKQLMLDDGVSKEITATANNSTNETVYLTFVDGATGAQGIETDTGLSYNPSTGNLTIGGELAAATLDISGNIDIDGTTNLDAVDIDGAVQLDATLTVGVDDTGYDVKFFGDAASAYMQWDASADDLILGGAARVVVPDGQLVLGSTAVASTATELNIMDGGTSATSTTLADADRVVVNDAGTMKQVALTDFETYMETSLDTLANVTTVGALNAGSITSGFGSIDVGSSSITTTGAISGGSVTVGDAALNEAELEILDGATVTTAELNLLDGTVAGTVVASKVLAVDANKDIASFRNITLTGELDAGSLDVSGNVDIDGTLETDALSIDGTTVTSTAAELNILDGVTATAAELNIMDGGTSGSSITVVDADRFVMNDDGTMKQVNASFLKTYFGLVTGGTAISALDIDGAPDIGAALADADEIIVDDGGGGTNRKSDMSRVKTYVSDLTLTTAAQTNITSVGTLTALTVDNLGVNGNTITANSGALNLTPASGSAIVLDGTISVDAGVVTGATSITSTAFVGDITGDVTGNADTATLATTATISANNSANETVYPTFVDGATGTQGLETDTGLNYNPSTGMLTSTGFTGALTGNASTATTLATTRAISITGDVTASGVNFNGSAAIALNTSLASNAVVTASITDGNVTTAKIAADAITGAKIADDAINSEHYVDGSIDAAHIASNAVTTAKINADAVTGAKIADNAINSEHYTDGSIDTAHYADNSVTEAKMANDAIGSAEMKTLRTFTLKDSGGSALFTMYGAGA